MSSPTFSIIVPVHNVEGFVKKTLLSVKNQTLSPNEVIIINDGSKDNSINIIKKFKKLKGWKIFQTKNQGLGLTRNFGISLAKSEYIYFLDSDDIIEKDFLYKIRKLVKKYNKPDMILFSGKTFSFSKKKYKKINLKFTIKGQFFKRDKLLTKLVSKKETLPQVSRYVTKKKLWTINKLKFPRGIAEDESVFFPLIALSKNTVVNTQSYYRYQINRPGSISMDLVKSVHALDYLNRIYFTLDFMKLNYDLIKFDYSAWCHNLERKSFKYINLCLKTKNKISWNIIIIIFFKSKSFFYLIKIFWRIVKNFFKY